MKLIKELSNLSVSGSNTQLLVSKIKLGCIKTSEELIDAVNRINKENSRPAKPKKVYNHRGYKRSYDSRAPRNMQNSANDTNIAL